MATIKQALQNVAAQIGVKVPDSFVSNAEPTARRLLQAGRLAGRHLTLKPWRALTFEHTFATVSGTQEYALPTSPAFHALVAATANDRTNYRTLRGPETPTRWQRGEAELTPTTAIEHRFRIKSGTTAPRTDKIYLLDDPAGAYTLAFEYVTREWLYDGSSTYYDDIAADADQVLFDDELFELEATWRILKTLGEAYFDEKDEALRLADVLYARENPMVVDMRRRRVEWPYSSIPETGYA